ncbi:MAG TPA: hypothetical protein VG870_14895 [Chitinophagaceae bacterium]|nr:hypothetical protein [Chitinophagaceae bacterium]
MNTGYYISVWLHIILAAFWIGGMLFLPLVLLPAIRENPRRRELLTVTGLKFRFYGWIVLVGLVATGLLNLHLRGLPLTWHFLFHSRYGQLLSWKLVLFFSLLVVSLTHDLLIGRRALRAGGDTVASARDGVTFQTRIARWSGRILLLVSLAMAFIGVVLSRGG